MKALRFHKGSRNAFTSGSITDRASDCGQNKPGYVRPYEFVEGLLTGEIFNTFAEAKSLIEAWRSHYNTSGRTAHLATVHQPRKRRQRYGYPPGSAALHLRPALALEAVLHRQSTRPT